MVKGVLAKRPEVVLSVSATTRAPRPGERNGVDYHFLSAREFEELRERGGFLEWAEVYGNFYGTPRDAVESAMSRGRDVLCELDIQGALAIKRAKPEAILIFVEPPSLDDLFTRLRGRGTDDPETIAKRVKAAYAEVKNKGSYDHIVVNDRLEDAVDQVVRILDE